MEPFQRPDLVLAADFTAGGDFGRRLAQEVRQLWRAGSVVGLLDCGAAGAGAGIAPEVAACLRRGQARWLADVAAAAGAARLILHQPARLAGVAAGAGWEGLREVAVVCHDAADMAAPVGFGAGVRVIRHPVCASLRHAAVQKKSTLGRRWLPVAEVFDNAPVAGRRAAVGWLGRAPQAAELPQFDHVDLTDTPLPLARLVAGLEAVVIAEPADALVAAMLASGRVVVAVPGLRARYGAGPVYDDDAARGLARARMAGKAGGFVAACRSGPVMGLGAGRAVARRDGPRPILCLSSNGVGVGHLTRLLAIARRIGGEAEVVFATQAQAVGVVESFGYSVDYIPSPGAVGGDFALWDAWFAAHLGRIVDRHDPALVIYDGNHPSDGLMRAVASRPDCRLAWVRRGMWGDTVSDFIGNARWCDLVIEPGELAAERDGGITAARRGEALVVDPIRLLDPCDLFSREAAAAHLGLNPARPAVLVQLGSGYQRDLLSMLDEIVRILGTVPGLQICVAEWVNGSVPLTLWPEVTVLRGFPLSQYVRAFDFCISAAGYNSFHELVGFGVPAIFVANRHPSMDDQYGRAKFAQDNAAAFELAEGDLHELAEMVPLMMQDVARAYLADRCARLARPNGAEAAAAALLELAGVAPRMALAAE